MCIGSLCPFVSSKCYLCAFVHLSCVFSSPLTSADLGADSLCQGAALCQLFSEALAHVVVNVIGTQQLLKGLGGVAQVLGQDVAHATPLSHPLAQVRQLTGLRLY